jgi:hypothetical protein
MREARRRRGLIRPRLGGAVERAASTGRVLRWPGDIGVRRSTAPRSPLTTRPPWMVGAGPDTTIAAAGFQAHPGHTYGSHLSEISSYAKEKSASPKMDTPIRSLILCWEHLPRKSQSQIRARERPRVHHRHRSRSSIDRAPRCVTELGFYRVLKVDQQGPMVSALAQRGTHAGLSASALRPPSLADRPGLGLLVSVESRPHRGARELIGCVGIGFKSQVAAPSGSADRPDDFTQAGPRVARFSQAWSAWGGSTYPRSGRDHTTVILRFLTEATGTVIGAIVLFILFTNTVLDRLVCESRFPLFGPLYRSSLSSGLAVMVLLNSSVFARSPPGRHISTPGSPRRRFSRGRSWSRCWRMGSSARWVGAPSSRTR